MLYESEGGGYKNMYNVKEIFEWFYWLFISF